MAKNRNNTETVENEPQIVPPPDALTALKAAWAALDTEYNSLVAEIDQHDAAIAAKRQRRAELGAALGKLQPKTHRQTGGGRSPDGLSEARRVVEAMTRVMDQNVTYQYCDLRRTVLAKGIDCPNPVAYQFVQWAQKHALWVNPSRGAYVLTDAGLALKAKLLEGDAASVKTETAEIAETVDNILPS